jgi:hypothetical protein
MTGADCLVEPQQIRTPRAMTDDQDSNRRAAPYRASLERSLSQLRAGEGVELPAPKTREEFMALLDRLKSELSTFKRQVDTAFQAPASAASTPDAAPSPTTPDLSKLSLEDKLALGRANCRRLGHLALGLAAESALDGLEVRLPEDAHSKAQAEALLGRLARTSK